MANSTEVDKDIYYVPEQGWYPVFLAFGLMLLVTGMADSLNTIRGQGVADWTQSLLGFVIVSFVLYAWFAIIAFAYEKYRKIF